MRGIIITGTSRGLGKALLDILVKKDIPIISISRATLKNEYIFDKVFHLNIDFSKKLTLEQLDLLEKILKKNSITELFFINNAGVISPIDFIGNLNNEEIYQNLNVNLLSPILIINKIISIGIIEKLTILNISSGAANKVLQGWSCYSTSKAAMLFFLNALIEENKNNNKIEVINIDPGVMDTDMQESIRKSSKDNFPLVDKFIEYKESNLLKSPQEVAKDIINRYMEFIL